MRSRWANAAIVVLTLVALGIQSALVARTGFFMGDFRAFYCASAVAAHGANPYHVEPLRSCESAIGPKRFFETNPGISIPAPLPGYAIGIFEPLSVVPFPAAAAIWLTACIAALVVCTATIARCASVAWPMVLAALMLSLGAASIPFGEVVPVALAAICACAYWARRGQWLPASIAAAVAMIEPHIGLPTCVALFVWARPTRVPLAIAAAVLGAIALVAIGPAANWEYFARVLPAHALSEAARDTQYSLTSVLASFGVAPSTAVQAGSLSYLVMLVVGTATAGLVAKKLENQAFLACVPPAFAVLGGTFIHVTQIAVALPAALLLAAYAKGEVRSLAATAVLLLSVPWSMAWWSMAWSPLLGVAPALLLAYEALYYWPGTIRPALVATLVGLLLLIGFTALSTRVKSAPSHSYAAAPIDASLPEASWSKFSLKNSTGSLGAWAVRLPTWSGLALLLVLLVREADMLALSRTRPLKYQPREAP